MVVLGKLSLMHAWSGRGASPGLGSKLRKQTRRHCTTEGGEFGAGSKSCRDGVRGRAGKAAGTIRWQTARTGRARCRGTILQKSLLSSWMSGIWEMVVVLETKGALSYQG